MTDEELKQHVEEYWAEAADVLVRFYNYTPEEAAEKAVWLRKHYRLDAPDHDHEHDIFYHELPYYWVCGPLGLEPIEGMAEYYNKKFWE